MTIEASPSPIANDLVTTRRLASLAIVGASMAAALVVVAADTEGDDGSGGADWILGLLLILAPLLAAAVTRSVASSTLLRPVGGIATVVCGLASSVHVAVAINERGAAGWAYGSPAIATSALLLAAWVRGPDRRRGDRPGGVRHPATEHGEADPPGDDLAGRPPLDVITPLGIALDHAIKAGLAWLVVLFAVSVVSVPILRVLGWPTVTARLEARVVDIRAGGDGSAVTFEAEHQDRTVRWTYTVEDSNWELGERNVAFMDDEGRVHEDQQFGLAGIPVLMSVGFVAYFAIFAARRLWGLLIAWSDASNGNDAPRLGYAAVIDDPAPRTWRPLLAVWEHDPTGGPRLAKPDAVYRADDETSEELQCFASSVVVRRAWIDTGIWPGSKPRWVGFEDGVAVPHRRSFFGRWYIRAVTRRSDVARVVGLDHGPPNPGFHGPRPAPDRRSHHRIGRMVLWRLLAVVAGIGLAFVQADAGHPIQTQRSRILVEAGR